MGDGWQPIPAGEEKAIRAAWVAHLQPAGDLEFPSAYMLYVPLFRFWASAMRSRRSSGSVAMPLTTSRRRNSRSAVSPDPGGKYGDAANYSCSTPPVKIR